MKNYLTKFEIVAVFSLRFYIRVYCVIHADFNIGLLSCYKCLDVTAYFDAGISAEFSGDRIFLVSFVSAFLISSEIIFEFLIQIGGRRYIVSDER